MNQILFHYEDTNKFHVNKKYSFLKKVKHLYLFIFIILIIIILIIFSYIIYNKQKIYQENKKAEKMINTYHITTLYSSDSNYDSIKLSNHISIIGLIEIPKINISYPILGESNEELLKISVCRFSRSIA